MLGAQGLFGKSCVYEGALRVPLVMCGPDIEPGTIESAPVSHVDLFPTLVESVGVEQHPDDADLPGMSLFSQIPADRPIFAEYHATGTTGGIFVLRRGKYKLIYHVGYSNELYDLETDPDEIRDLGDEVECQSVMRDLVAHLKTICDPESVNYAAMDAQRRKVQEFGGRDALLRGGSLVFTPPPGKAPELTTIR
jgi:choline-sulfatase